MTTCGFRFLCQINKADRGGEYRLRERSGASGQSDVHRIIFDEFGAASPPLW
jgi:hypothetical protein